MRADSVHVRHASVEVNVVIGVVLCGLLVGVRVVPVVVCDDAVVRRTLVLIAFIVAFVFFVFVVAIFHGLFGCIGSTVFTLPSVTANCC